MLSAARVVLSERTELALGGIQQLTKVAPATDDDQAVFGGYFAAAALFVAHRLEAAELGLDCFTAARGNCAARAARYLPCAETAIGDDAEIRSRLGRESCPGDGEHQLIESRQRIE